MSRFHSARHLLLVFACLPLLAAAQNISPVPTAGAAPVPHGRGVPRSGPEGMPPLPFREPMPGPFLPPELRELDLSEAQQDEVFLILHAQAPALRDAMKKSRHAEEALRSLSLAASFDAARARALAEAAGKAHGEIVLLHATAQARIRALLTPEQRRHVEENGRAWRPPFAPAVPEDKISPR
ncbi:Spy/CpxP family protein refolding chaperone [Uliginosibacterium sp. 31-16]|uniref:Spy/CpxP family protein refolding chaperone n=1 Tax=Uliginosibacterium sp. 31-16 TaxID=3068315 RepID=UPI00273E1D09|nr:Spy/CpxP family protein refolding chaperone [Uliginosibacterium sp. 31-16]MDP5240196.1 Spy/CpxP family protein refolding chaperone [Uliginosibacterium sp. 31-16]